MKKQLVLWGGMGSVHLHHSVAAAGTPLSRRPDTRLGGDFSRRPTSKEAEGFHARSGFLMDCGSSINDNLLLFLKFLKVQGRVATWGKSWMEQFFSRYKIQNLVFLVRHPLHMYVSLCGRRHPVVGGIHKPSNVKWFAGLWNDLVLEGMLTASPFIRYEYASEDFPKAKIGWLAPAIKSWNPGSRNFGELSPDHEDLLRDLTAALYNQLYRRWKV